MDWYI